MEPMAVSAWHGRSASVACASPGAHLRWHAPARDHQPVEDLSCLPRANVKGAAWPRRRCSQRGSILGESLPPQRGRGSRRHSECMSGTSPMPGVARQTLGSRAAPRARGMSPSLGVSTAEDAADPRRQGNSSAMEHKSPSEESSCRCGGFLCVQRLIAREALGDSPRGPHVWAGGVPALAQGSAGTGGCEGGSVASEYDPRAASGRAPAGEEVGPRVRPGRPLGGGSPVACVADGQRVRAVSPVGAATALGMGRAAAAGGGAVGQAPGNHTLTYCSMAVRSPVVSAPAHGGWPGSASSTVNVPYLLLFAEVLRRSSRRWKVPWSTKLMAVASISPRSAWTTARRSPA